MAIVTKSVYLAGTGQRTCTSTICHCLKHLASHKVSVCVYLVGTCECVRSAYMDHTLSEGKSLFMCHVTTHSHIISISAHSHHALARSSICRSWTLQLVDFSKITLACSESSRHVITYDCLNTVTVPLAVVHCPLHVLCSAPIMHTPVGVQEWVECPQ